MGKQVTFYDKKSGASINYMGRLKEEASPDEAVFREISWPDGATAIQEWPVEGVEIDEAPHPFGVAASLEAFDPDQPRAPKGSSQGGQWTDGGGWEGAASGESGDIADRAQAARDRLEAVLESEDGDRKPWDALAGDGSVELAAAKREIEDPGSTAPPDMYDEFPRDRSGDAEETIRLFEKMEKAGGTYAAGVVLGSGAYWHLNHTKAYVEWEGAHNLAPNAQLPFGFAPSGEKVQGVFAALAARTEFMQEAAKERYGESFTLYRGLHSERPAGEFDLKVRALSSWTIDPEVTKAFGQTMVKREASYKDVWRVDHIGAISTPYEDDATEVVLLQKEATTKAINITDVDPNDMLVKVRIQ